MDVSSACMTCMYVYIFVVLVSVQKGFTALVRVCSFYT